MKLQHIPLVGIVILGLSACASGQPEPSQAQVRRQLATVTPVLATDQPVVLPAATRTVAPATPTVTPTAAPPPTIIETAEGPLTPSMVALKLGAERYAALGDPAAPITIVEFSDHGCPSCRQFELATFPGLHADYIETGKVYSGIPASLSHQRF